MIQIAVLGYGTVGSGVVEVINTNHSSINKKAGEEINIKYVLDLRDFPGDPIQEKIVHDFDVILNDPEIKIVVEVMGGVEPAYTFTKKALLAGKSVCTSNKELVARHGAELLEIARERNINYLFEASCGGGIPIIRPLNSSLTADEIDEITGILNGTTNYILTEMAEKGSDFADVLKEAQNLINSYYEERPVHVSADERTEEADKVSSRIAEILSENAFSFSPNEYISIHHRLFKGIYKHAGKIRDYNITKKEWVLDGASVIYGSASELRSTLEYDFLQERGYSYKGLSMDEIIHHFAVFVSRLWQIHIFGEGNTRTTAVFFIKYLRTLGFSVTNSIFAENAWYFRNALVRANYTDLQKGVHETTEYLEVFLRNLLLNEKNELHNRSLHISGLWDDKKVDIGDGKVDIETRKVDIEIGKVDIETPKVDITHTVAGKAIDFSARTLTHIDILFEKFGYDKIFGRSAIMDTLELKSSGASKLISNLLQADIIEPVSGHGKGKYKFKE